MKIMPASFNKINVFKPSFKNKEANEEIYFSKVQDASSKRKAEAQEIFSYGETALLRANTIKKIAQRKYQEAEEIQWDWQKEKPAAIEKNGIKKEYFINDINNLNLYIEKRADGTERTIQYISEKPVKIIEIDTDGKKYIYFYDKKSLARYIEGKHTQEMDKNERAIVTPREFVFSPLGNLMIYRENQRDISAYNRYQELSGEFATIDMALYFDTLGRKTYLKKAKNGLIASPSGNRFVKDEFIFDSRGKLVR